MRAGRALVVTETSRDPRFEALPTTVDGQRVRFFASQPLHLGARRSAALVVLDTRPRTLDTAQAERFSELARVGARALRLDAREERYRQMLHLLDVPVAVVGADGRLTRLNRAARHLAPARATRLIGRRAEQIAPDEPWQGLAALAGEVARVRRLLVRSVVDRATHRSWEIAARPLPAARRGGPAPTLLVAHETTCASELRASLRRQELMATLGALIAGVAHEVRSPLFCISATLDAFEARFAGRREYSDFVETLRAEVLRMGAIMQELLDYGRPSEMAAGPDAVVGPIQEALRTCESLARSKGVALRLSVPARVPCVRMDPHRLPQVFRNLIENAVQHSPQGGAVAVDVSGSFQHERPWVDVAVIDDGPGFRPEDLRRAFEPFFSRRPGGLGLGLSIVQRIVDDHHGHALAANRAADRGAILLVRLPEERGAGV